MWYLEDWNTAYTMSEKVSWSRVPLIRNTSAASATREGRRREREGRRVQRRERRGGEEEERREERGGEEDRSIHYLCISTWFLPCTAHLSAAH